MCAFYLLVLQSLRLDRFCSRFCSCLDNVNTSMLSKYCQHSYSRSKSTSRSSRNELVKRADRVSSVFYRCHGRIACLTRARARDCVCVCVCVCACIALCWIIHEKALLGRCCSNNRVSLIVFVFIGTRRRWAPKALSWKSDCLPVFCILYVKCTFPESITIIFHHNYKHFNLN